MADLFQVFHQQQSDDEEIVDSVAVQAVESSSHQKRPVSPAAVVDLTGDEDVPTVNDAEPESKKQKLAQENSSSMPASTLTTTADRTKTVLTDAFETQAEMEFSGPSIDAETGAKVTESKPVKLAHQIRHQVALPPDYPYVPIADHQPPENPARTYPFTLDPFQQVSVACIERNESVLVSAHTSAGKTVVAEYAIATALRNKQRVIYTSPIKALSNQKFRELQAEFTDVGLMTGDVTINPSASCLVMTTEILRSMMYRGSEIMREVAWVVFDEIHYMRDRARGVIWEETIILLPHKVRYVFLSATIPNAKQFAEWICNIHDQPCHIVYTDFRPVPLQHYVYPAGGDGIYLCVDEKSNFREDNFTRAMAVVAKSGSSKGPGGKGRRPQKDLKSQSELFKIIKMIWMRNYQPVIVFSFNKRECESNALQMSKLDFNDANEKELVSAVFKNAVGNLSEDDQQLPQIQHLLPLLQRGIGIHHSGLLQILKEVIEILFQEGLIKVLFATETFSIGLNMPAKTVVFTSVEKFDGKEMRCVSSGEYIQMSGRAGRRGLDDRGIVIMMVGSALEPATAKEMLKGQADCLNSAFHLTYNMILNLMRVEGISPEYMLERSFFQFQNNESVPQLEEKLRLLEKEKDEFKIEDEETIAEYFNIKQQLEMYKKDFRDVVHHPTYCLPFLQPGRLVKVNNPGVVDYGWAVAVNFNKRTPNKNTKSDKPAQPEYILDVLLYCAKGSSERDLTKELPPPCLEGETGELCVVPVSLDKLDGISTIRVFLPKDLRKTDARNQVFKSINEVKRRFPDGVPLLDPVQDMAIKDESFVTLVSKIAALEKQLMENPLSSPSQVDVLKQQYREYSRKMELKEQMKLVKKEIKRVTAILQLDELKCRKRVLRRLGYTSASDVIELKGRVACEISTGDELLLAEMMFNGVFNDLTVPQIVALLSCIVCDERAELTDKLRDELTGPHKILRETARRIAKVSIESKLVLDEQEYVDGFQAAMMNLIYAWCEGAKFSQICKMTDIFEGSIIRVIRRLEELLRQMAAASKQIGNAELEAKFQEGIAKIKRDIVFAASLYL